MAELLGVIASGAGLVSLAVQLGDSIQKIRRLHKSFKSAPAILEDYAYELETFGLALYDLERDRQRDNPVDHRVIERCIRTCEQASGRIRAAIDKLEAAMQRSSFKGRLYTALDHTEVIQLCNDLEKSKTSLVLAYQLYVESCRKKDHNLMVQLLEENTRQISQHTFLVKAYHQDPQQITSDVANAWINQADSSGSASSLGRVVGDDANGCSILQTRTKDVLTIQRTSNYRKPRKKWRVHFSPWLTTQIWELSVTAAQTGWNLNVKPSNIVPRNALIFEACRDGALREVQALFDAGQASPFDYSPGNGGEWGTTVFTAAASSGNIQLCKYLLGIAGYPNMPADTLDPLDVFALSQRAGDDTLIGLEMYRLVSSQPEWTIGNLNDPGSIHYWWLFCPDISCLRLIRNEFYPDICEMAWPRQVQLALDYIDCNLASPATLLELLGCKTVDRRAIEARGVSGCTVFHAISGSVYRRDQGESAILMEWADFVRESVAKGADLHTTDKDGETPFMYAFKDSMYGDRRNLREWLKLLEIAGVDLDAYGRSEMAMWQMLRRRGLPWYGYRIRGWTFGPTAEDWTFDIQRTLKIPIYAQDATPGAWPVADGRGEVICWEPEEEDVLDVPWQWRGYQRVNIRAADAAAVPYHADQSDYQPLYHKIFGSQDDCGMIVRLIETSCMAHQRPRSYSLPAFHDRPEGMNEPQTRGWISKSHRCILDGRMKLGYQNARKCAKDLHNYDPDDLWEDSSQGIDFEMRSFRRRYQSVQELRDLPYTAYQPAMSYRSYK